MSKCVFLKKACKFAIISYVWNVTNINLVWFNYYISIGYKCDKTYRVEHLECTLSISTHITTCNVHFIMLWDTDMVLT